MDATPRRWTDNPNYKNRDHATRALEALHILRRNQQLCDVILVAGTSPEERAEADAGQCSDLVEIASHRAVLAACSPYFYAMFTADMTEARQMRIYIQINPQALALLVDYMYTSEIHISEENVQILLPAANLLQIVEVSLACCEYLKAQLHPSNCLGIRAFADIHGCTDLLAYANSFTEQFFADLVQCEEFHNLSAMQVARLISSDNTVATEEKIFESVIAWVKHDPDQRRHRLPELMAYVRLPLLPQEYLIEKVDTEPLVKESTECKDYLIEALKFHLVKPESRNLIFETKRIKPRMPIGLPKMMVVIGGQAPKAIRNVDLYDFQLEKWYAVADLPQRRCRCGVAVLNGLVYAIGGFNGNLRVRTVDVYDPMRDTWTSVPSMEARRSTLGVAVLNGLIVAVGGFDGSTGLDSVEAFDPRTGEWRMLASMSIRRSSVGVGVVKGMLYAIGGYDGQSRQCLASVERYDPVQDRWFPAAEMLTRRSGAGIGVLDNVMYAVGGHDGPVVKKSAEMYDAEIDVWRPIADMSLCRRNAGVIALNGLLYAVGGDDGSSNLVSVEIYNPKTDVWSMLPSCMSIGRSYAGVAIINKSVP